MKNLKFVKLVAVLGIVAFVSNYASAHTALSESTPKDGAMVMEAPDFLQLKFTESVRLLKVAVMMGEKELEIDFTPSVTASNQFAVALPKLEHGGYTVSWSVMGADSHRVEGKLDFMVGMMAGHDEHGGVGHDNGNHAGQEQHSGHGDSNQAAHGH